MSTSCSGCGSCCDPVTFDVVGRRKWLMDWAKSSDPRIDVVWKSFWRRSPNAWKDENRPNAIRLYLDACFIIDHWHPLGDGDALCDAFDPKTRTCLAYDERPAICQDFPWYDKDPVASVGELPEQVPWCSFLPDAGVEPEPIPVTIRRKMALA